MYKVFINDKPLFFEQPVAEKKDSVIHFLSDDSITVAIDRLENDPSCKEIYLYHSDSETLKNSFTKIHHYIEAAGGIIKNSKEEILFIFRLDKWDLPKGKIEPGENTKEAALREVEEECGVKETTILRELPSTYHTYMHKGKRILKRTYWFEMFCKDDHLIKPQIEEDITDIKWLPKENIRLVLDNTYASIKEIITAYQAS